MRGSQVRFLPRSPLSLVILSEAKNPIALPASAHTQKPPLPEWPLFSNHSIADLGDHRSLEPELRSKRDPNIVMRAVLEVHHVSHFRPHAKPFGKRLNAAARIEHR